MNNWKNNFYEEGIKLKYKKSFGILCLVIFMLFVCGDWCYEAFDKIIGVLIFKKFNSDGYSIYVEGLMCLLATLGVSINLVNYCGNKIIISDSFIIIKRAAFGKTYKISKKCIIAKDSYVGQKGAVKCHLIILHLKNGKKIRTGFLNCIDKEFDRIYKEFNFTNIMQLKSNYQKSELEEGELEIKTNRWLQLLTFSPIFLIVVLILN